MEGGMNGSILTIIIAVVLAGHTIGHIQGVLAASSRLGTERWNLRSWLLDGVLGEANSRRVALVLWSLIMVGFLATTLAFLGWGLPHAWWGSLGIVFAVLSTLTLVFYWNSFVLFFPSKMGALAVNLAILVGQGLLSWPSVSDLAG
jgi:hypothetical protein